MGYAKGLAPDGFDFGGLRCPFLYATNGEVLWFHDVRHELNRSRRISGLHTPTALRELLGRDFDAAADTALELPHDHPRLRPYQKDANAAVKQAIAERTALLEGFGYEVVTETAADRVMEHLTRSLFDIVLLDLVMPAVSGLELLREIRAELATLPIIIVTGYGSFDAAVDAMRAGASDLIAKPIDATMLDLRIRKTLDLEHTRRLANTDGLTGVYNHRYLQERLLQEVSRAHRHGRPLSLLMLDLDAFKACNDSWGHPFGDQVLIEVARLLRSTCRVSDLVARYGGEGFVVVLPETDGDHAGQLADRLRQIIGGGELATQSGAFRPLPTVSVRVATLREGEMKEDVIRRSDRALYAAKRAGRDRVVYDTESAPAAV